MNTQIKGLNHIDSIKTFLMYEVSMKCWPPADRLWVPLNTRERDPYQTPEHQPHPPLPPLRPTTAAMTLQIARKL